MKHGFSDFFSVVHCRIASKVVTHLGADPNTQPANSQTAKPYPKFFSQVLTQNTPNLQWLRPQSFILSSHLNIELFLVPWISDCTDPSAVPPLLRLAVLSPLHGDVATAQTTLDKQRSPPGVFGT